MKPIDKFILHVVHNWKSKLNEAYSPAVVTQLMNKFKEEADDLNIEINDEQLKKYIERFDVIKNSPKIQEKDLFKYSLSQLIKLATTSKGAETPEAADITPDVVYHNDDDTIIVYNGSKEDNCIRYGQGERWCITRGSYSNYRYSQDRSYPTFYLAQNNNLSTDDALSFVAIQVRNPQTTSENERYVYTNRKNSPNESRPMSFSQLEREVPWLREIPNVQQVLKYIPLNTGEKITQQYKNTPIGIREWVKLPFDVKQQYLVVRKGKQLFNDVSNDEFLSKYLPKFPQLAEFIAITPGIFQTEELLKHLDAFSNNDRRSIIANMRDKVELSNLKSEALPFDVKKLLTTLGKWNLGNDERIYITKDGNAIVKLKLGDDITVGVYTAEDDYPSVKLNKRTSKYLTDYPELDKIPFKSLIKLSSDEIIDKSLVDQTLEAAKNDPNSAILVKDTDNGQIVVDSNSFASYKVDNGKITQIPFDSEEVQVIFDEQTDNEGFQQNVLNLFNQRGNIPDQIDRVGLTSILKSISNEKRTIGTTDYSNFPVGILTTDEENPLIFTVTALPNTRGESPFYAKVVYGTRNDWRDGSTNERFTPEMTNAYFAYLRGLNQTFTDEGLINALSSYGMPTDFTKSILTNPNLPLQDTNIYRPAEYQGTVYLINTQNPAESKKISDTSGKLIKANINSAAARRLLGAQQAEPEAPAAEPGAVVRVPRDNAPQAPPAGAPGERRRGRPAGVANAPREPQQRAQGDIDIPTQFNNRGLEAGFTNLPRNDFRRLNVDDATQVPRIGDRGATARDNQLGRAGQVTSVFNVGPSKIYFIRLNTPEPTTIASINIQPGNRNYVVVGNRSYSLNSPRELMTFLQNRDLAEGLRTSMFKLHLQENPYMIDEIKQLNNMKNLKEEYSTEESFKDYSNDALTDMIINSSRFEGNEEAIERIKQELARRKQAKNVNEVTPAQERYRVKPSTKPTQFKQDIAAAKKMIDAGKSEREVVAKYGQAAFNAVNAQNLGESKPNSMKEDLKKYIREAIQKRLMENQPAPSRKTEPGETETIPDRGTEEEKKRRRIGNPNVEPKPKAMNENEQEIIKRIVARFKSKK